MTPDPPEFDTVTVVMRMGPDPCVHLNRCVRPTGVRLRAFLKAMKRAHGIKCLSIRPGECVCPGQVSSDDTSKDEKPGETGG